MTEHLCKMQAKVCNQRFEKIDAAFTQLRELLRIEDTYKSEALKKALDALEHAIEEDEKRFEELEKRIENDEKVIDELHDKVGEVKLTAERKEDKMKIKTAYFLGVFSAVMFLVNFLWKAIPKLFNLLMTMKTGG